MKPEENIKEFLAKGFSCSDYAPCHLLLVNRQNGVCELKSDQDHCGLQGPSLQSPGELRIICTRKTKRGLHFIA